MVNSEWIRCLLIQPIVALSHLSKLDSVYMTQVQGSNLFKWEALLSAIPMVRTPRPGQFIIKQLHPAE